jgi:hypothetical protein
MSDLRRQGIILCSKQLNLSLQVGKLLFPPLTTLVGSDAGSSRVSKQQTIRNNKGLQDIPIALEKVFSLLVVHHP